MMLAGSFLSGAGDRLLPASIPFRYFGAGVLFHVAAWGMLFLGAEDAAGFVGGTGPVLAAIHLLTLGFFTMVAMGAAFQLLPVATRQPLASTWPARLCFWLLAPGTIILAYGMAETEIWLLEIGTYVVVAALAIFAVLTADNLRRAGSLAIVAAHGWLALAALVGFALFGLLLILDFERGFLPDHQTIALLHMGYASYGFMSLLAFGFSLVLVPMFALSRAPEARPSVIALGFALLALILFTLQAFVALPLGLPLAGLSALVAALIYVGHMLAILKKAMRKRLGLSFVLIRASWAGLVLSLLAGLALALGAPLEPLPALFGFLLLVAWLLPFLCGILQRIAPFLASMHVTDHKGMPPLMSDMASDFPLRAHALLHGLALCLCLPGIAFDIVWLIRFGAIVGALGATAFAAFVLQVAIGLKNP